MPWRRGSPGLMKYYRWQWVDWNESMLSDWRALCELIFIFRSSLASFRAWRMFLALIRLYISLAGGIIGWLWHWGKWYLTSAEYNFMRGEALFHFFDEAILLVVALHNHAKYLITFSLHVLRLWCVVSSSWIVDERLHHVYQYLLIIRSIMPSQDDNKYCHTIIEEIYWYASLLS